MTLNSSQFVFLEKFHRGDAGFPGDEGPKGFVGPKGNQGNFEYKLLTEKDLFWIGFNNGVQNCCIQHKIMSKNTSSQYLGFKG